MVEGFDYDLIPKPPYVTNKRKYRVALESGDILGMLLEEATE